MKAISFRDVIFALKSLGVENVKELDLVSPENDSKIAHILFALGIDILKPITIRACNHRDLNNNTGIGYRYEGDMRLDAEWLGGRGADVMDRISATSYYDLSLTTTLCGLVGTSSNVTKNMGYSEDEEFPEELISETYEQDVMLIEKLNGIVKQVRG